MSEELTPESAELFEIESEGLLSELKREDRYHLEVKKNGIRYLHHPRRDPSDEGEWVWSENPKNAKRARVSSLETGGVKIEFFGTNGRLMRAVALREIRGKDGVSLLSESHSASMDHDEGERDE